nr:hypothetical protein Iba_chr07aCG7820 [Ipomoea batatas]
MPRLANPPLSIIKLCHNPLTALSGYTTINNPQNFSPWLERAIQIKINQSCFVLLRLRCHLRRWKLCPLYGSVLRSEGSGGTLAYETSLPRKGELEDGEPSRELMCSGKNAAPISTDYNDEVEVGSFSVSSYNTVIEAVEHFMEVQDVSLGAVANQATRIPVILVISPPEDVGP